MKMNFVYCALCCATLLAGNAQAAGRIEIESFVLAPTQLERDTAFEVCVTVKASGVPTVSYVLRTSGPVEEGAGPPSFDHYETNRKLAF
ncbi:MAG: hypothetical protein L3K26_03450, partial [Candidatus Hydrogenedentes bacterium]|nr:hypothetical protein [Candidatus Hydrogenedentota bacterium]